MSELAITALVSGIHCYTGVAETSWFQQILAFGWRCEPLGTPRTHGRHELAGLRIDIDEDTMDALAAMGIYTPEEDEAVKPLARVAA